MGKIGDPCGSPSATILFVDRFLPHQTWKHRSLNHELVMRIIHEGNKILCIRPSLHILPYAFSISKRTASTSFISLRCSDVAWTRFAACWTAVNCGWSPNSKGYNLFLHNHLLYLFLYKYFRQLGEETQRQLGEETQQQLSEKLGNKVPHSVSPSNFPRLYSLNSSVPCPSRDLPF